VTFAATSVDVVIVAAVGSVAFVLVAIEASGSVAVAFVTVVEVYFVATPFSVMLIVIGF